MLPDNINNKFRKYIDDMLNIYGEKLFIRANDAYNFVAFNISENLKSDVNRETYIKNLLLFSVLLSDAYKILNHKFKDNTLIEYEILLYDLIKSQTDSDFLMNIIKNEPFMMTYLVKSTHNFYNMSSLGKKLLIKELSDKDNEHLNRLCVTHENDLIKYGAPLTRETIIEIYVNYKKYYQFKLNTTTYEDDEIIKMIASYIKKLYDIDPVEYENIINNIIDEKEDFTSIEEMIKEVVKKYEYLKK